MSNVTLENVGKSFGGFAAVRNLDLSVAPDEVLCLLGPSGCGKTTTLRMIAGLESASEGRIRFGARDMTRVPAERRDVAMAFQFYALYPDLTVGENLAFPLQAEGLRKPEKEERLRRISDVLQLDAVLARYPHELSEGEKQRVAVGRCIIRQPNAFLFDEPLSRLDVKQREEMRGSIRRILATLDRPTVIVTHDQLEAMTMGDRIAVMRNGMVEQAGKPTEVFDRPANLFVAGFIGTPQMTLLEARCRMRADDRLTLDIGRSEVAADFGTLGLAPREGEVVTLGFRPRAARIDQPADIVFPDAHLTLVENMGAERLLHFDWQGAAIRVLGRSFEGLREGARAAIGVSAGDVALFAADGRRIPRRGEVQ